MVSDNTRVNGSAMEMGNSNQELVSNASGFQRRKFLIIILAGCLVVGVIILGLVLFSGQPVDATAASKLSVDSGFDLDDFLNHRFIPNVFNGTFISGHEILLRNDQAEVELLNAVTGKREVLIRPSDFPILETGVSSFELSADRKYMLLAQPVQKLYRYSYIKHYLIYDIEKRQGFPLEWKGDRLILQAVWSPVGNGIAFVLHNTHDIYYKPKVEEPGFRITNTGIPGVIYNGVPDWVNEEEVFSSNIALWFSPDGSKLAYASFNGTLTRVMSIPYYGPPGNLSFQYTRALNIRYPKPGSPNPVVELDIVELGPNDVGSTFHVTPPNSFQRLDAILTAVTWPNDKLMAAVWMNRVQNESGIVLCDATTRVCNNILSISESKGWVDLFVPPIFSKDGSKMILILPNDQEGKGSFRHVTLVEQINHVYEQRPVTSGLYTVTEILHYDEDNNTVYYLATEPEHPEKLHLYEVRIGEEAKCISCNVKNKKGRMPCLYNKAGFGTGSNPLYYLSCLGPGVPEISIYNLQHERLIQWELNTDVYMQLIGKRLPKVKRLQIPVPGGFKAQVQVIEPPDMDLSGDTKYPLLVNVYGGPDSFQATERFHVDWSTYMVINKSIIYMTIDGRGSGLKGNDMLFAIYRSLGTKEIEDQINVTRYLQDTLPYIDRTRSAIWGWSYGGYATGMVLAKDTSNVFKCGISVAPVTDWAYYDTIYTERYMGLPIPSDNLRGYAQAQLNDKIENFRNKEFYLIHGTLDDNVHYQQSMMLAKALELNDILFSQQSYPDEEHGLSGVQRHLYLSIEKFLDQCFK